MDCKVEVFWCLLIMAGGIYGNTILEEHTYCEIVYTV